MDDRSNEIQAKAQTALIDFLNADLDLAFTMLETARIEATFDPQAVSAPLEHVRQALQTIRHFIGRVQDQNISAQIISRTGELEAALTAFAGK